MNTTRRSVESQQRREKVLTLRVEGRSFSEIGRELGIARQSARRLLVAELGHVAAENRETSETLIAMELRRLDFVAAYLASRVAGYERDENGKVVKDESGNPVLVDEQHRIAAAGLLIKLSESRRKLLGIDQDTRRFVNIEVANNTRIIEERLAQSFWRVATRFFDPARASQFATEMMNELAAVSAGATATAQTALAGPPPLPTPPDTQPPVDSSSGESDESHITA